MIYIFFLNSFFADILWLSVIVDNFYRCHLLLMILFISAVTLWLSNYSCRPIFLFFIWKNVGPLYIKNSHPFYLRFTLWYHILPLHPRSRIITTDEHYLFSLSLQYHCQSPPTSKLNNKQPNHH